MAPRGHAVNIDRDLPDVVVVVVVGLPYLDGDIFNRFSYPDDVFNGLP